MNSETPGLCPAQPLWTTPPTADGGAAAKDDFRIVFILMRVFTPNAPTQDRPARRGVAADCILRRSSLKPVRLMKSGHRAPSNPESIYQLGSEIRSCPPGQPRRRLLVGPD